MRIENEDLLRLAHEVRRFLGRTDLMTRLATRSRLYLEFPDMGTMHYAIRDILLAWHNPAYGLPDPQWIDEGTWEIDIAGISITLTCKQRFMTELGKKVGIRSVKFIEGPPWPPKE